MPLLAGDTNCTTGLAAAIYTGMKGNAACKVADGPELKAMSYEIANAVVTYIKANAVVNSLGLIAPPGTAGGPVTGMSTIS